MASKKYLTSILKRSFSTNSCMGQSTGPCEVRIPVPWGHLAGKWWGPQNQRPIMSLHGWQDNCGTFDRLIPLLPSNLSFLSIDMPGHGWSSRLPPGMFYHAMNGPLMIRQLQDYFKWEKISLMGHSLGAIISYTFACLYPSSVDFVICIDGLQHIINTKGLNSMVKVMDDYIKYDKQNENMGHAPCYSMEKLVELLNKGTRNSIEVDKCHYILNRNIKPCLEHPGQYYFDRDPRLKCGTLTTFSPDELEEAAHRATYPLFLSAAGLTKVFGNEGYFQKTVDIIEKNSKQFELHRIPGTHHVHLNQPELFKQIIPDFIQKYDTDRSKYSLPDEIRLKQENIKKSKI